MRATATLLAVTLLACSGGDPPDRDPEETTEPDGDTTMPTPMAGDGAPDVAEPMDSVAAPTPIPMTSTAPAPNVDAIFENECATATMQSSLLPSNLLFVLDRSESMACNPPPITTSTQCEDTPERADEIAFNKWEIVRISVSRAMKNLPPETNVGISYFSNDDSCGVHPVPRVPMAPLDGAQHSAIDASLASITPQGATPLVGATILAYQHLHEEALLGRVVGKKYVVLLTDGEQSEPCFDEPHCDGADSCTQLLLDSEVPKAAGEGVRINTFVIGAPGSEPARNVLSAMALAGGTAPDGCDPAMGDCHFDMTTQENFSAALDEALAQIAGRSALSCELPMPSVEDGEVDPGLVNVLYSPSTGGGPVVLSQDDAMPCDDGADGWQYNADGSRILLCGEACDTALGDRGGRMDVVLGCPAQRPE
ncbi:MAG: VWA domain-containing protein [Myxococcales bacterium]|nr:VWA domain-containing protein [Myxococcales bacterium]